MWCVNVKVGVVRCRLVGGSVPPHLGKRVGTGGVVVHHVQDDRYSPLVARVDKLLVHLVSTVRLVHREEERGVVAPAVVPVELLYRHQLDRVNPQCFEVVELPHRTLQVAALREITQQQLVDDHVVRLGRCKVGHFPRVGFLLDPEDRHDAYRSFWVLFRLGVGGGRNPRVVGGIQYLAGVGVGHAYRIATGRSHVILERVLP